jgi:hypothetical protein
VLLELLHVGADEHLAELDKVAVLLVVHLDDTPGVATAADLAAVGVGDLVIGTDNSEGDLGHDLVVLGDGLLVIELVAGALENLDLVVLDVCENLQRPISTNAGWRQQERTKLTLALKAATSSSVRVSALAITGIRLTLVCRRFMTSMSRGFREWPVGWMKKTHAWMRLSTMFMRLTLFSASR